MEKIHATMDYSSYNRNLALIHGILLIYINTGKGSIVLDFCHFYDAKSLIPDRRLILTMWNGFINKALLLPGTLVKDQALLCIPLDAASVLSSPRNGG